MKASATGLWFRREWERDPTNAHAELRDKFKRKHPKHGPLVITNAPAAFEYLVELTATGEVPDTKEHA